MRDKIFVRVEPKYIHYLGSIMEGYEYFGVVSTVKDEKDLVAIRVTPDTYEEVIWIVNNLPIPATIV
ncbi:MAG: DUF4911 domain-containing protein [Negativicutes bacterium]|nr:DUF4911 domain-containing protein [Negativicutes bacterium]